MLDAPADSERAPADMEMFEHSGQWVCESQCCGKSIHACVQSQVCSMWTQTDSCLCALASERSPFHRPHLSRLRFRYSGGSWYATRCTCWVMHDNDQWQWVAALANMNGMSTSPLPLLPSRHTWNLSLLHNELSMMACVLVGPYSPSKLQQTPPSSRLVIPMLLSACGLFCLYHFHIFIAWALRVILISTRISSE